MAYPQAEELHFWYEESFLKTKIKTVLINFILCEKQNYMQLILSPWRLFTKKLDFVQVVFLKFILN